MIFTKYIFRNWQHLLILSTVLLFAFFLRFYNLGFNDMYNDASMICRKGILFFQGQPGIIFSYRGGPLALLMPGLSANLFGVSDISCRLPSVIVGVLVVALTYEFGRLLFNARTGLISATIVAVSIPCILMSRCSGGGTMIDLFFILTIYSFYRYITEKKFYWGLIASLAFTFGIMTRVIILLCIPICLLIAWRYDKKLSFLKSKDFLSSTLPFWIFAYPYLLASFIQGFFVPAGYTQIFRESVNKFFWFGIPYYTKVIFTYFSPLNFLLFASVIAFLFLKFYYKKQRLNNSEIICILWFFSVFLFYAILIEKHKEFYILGALYPLAILGGALFDYLLKNKKKIIVIFVLIVLLSGNVFYSYNTVFKEQGFRVPYDTYGSYHRCGLKALGWYMHEYSSPGDHIVPAGYLDEAVIFYTNRRINTGFDYTPPESYEPPGSIITERLGLPQEKSSDIRFAISTIIITQQEEKEYIEKVKKEHPIVAIIRVNNEDSIYVYDLKETNMNITPIVINEEDVEKEYKNSGSFS